MKTIIVTFILFTAVLSQAEVTIVTLLNLKGVQEILHSDNLELTKKPLNLGDIYTSQDFSACEGSETKKLKQHLELDVLLESLISQNRLGPIHRHEISKTPDCPSFRFKLYVLSTINQGYTLESIKTESSPSESSSVSSESAPITNSFFDESQNINKTRSKVKRSKIRKARKRQTYSTHKKNKPNLPDSTSASFWD